MNFPFPDLTPRLIDTKWFNADSPCDEETDLSSMEHIYQSWLTSVSQQYSKRTPLGKTAPEPMEEEAETDEEEGNDDSDESEESHDEDEDEELRTSYSPPPRASVNNNDVTANEEAMEDESTRDVQADIPASSVADDTSS